MHAEMHAILSFTSMSPSFQQAAGHAHRHRHGPLAAAVVANTIRHHGCAFSNATTLPTKIV
jgi:hypothetical protein